MIVYTAIFGDYDTLRTPHVLDPSIRYVCFADDMPSETNGWQIRLVPPSGEHPRLQQRFYKIQAHRAVPEAGVSLYIDGNFELVRDPRELIDEYLANADLAFFKHPERDGIYAELKTCADLGKDDPETLAAVADRYRTSGLPEEGFLYAGGFILRRHTAKIAEFNEMWYAEVRRSSFRDQPALGYTMWRTGIHATTIDKNIWKNDLFKYYAHNHKQS